MCVWGGGGVADMVREYHESRDKVGGDGGRLEISLTQYYR